MKTKGILAILGCLIVAGYLVAAAVDALGLTAPKPNTAHVQDLDTL
jgi:hypothetical protein